jgi:hypothetical protein
MSSADFHVMRKKCPVISKVGRCEGIISGHIRRKAITKRDSVDLAGLPNSPLEKLCLDCAYKTQLYSTLEGYA